MPNCSGMQNIYARNEQSGVVIQSVNQYMKTILDICTSESDDERAPDYLKEHRPLKKDDINR